MSAGNPVHRPGKGAHAAPSYREKYKSPRLPLSQEEEAKLLQRIISFYDEGGEVQAAEQRYGTALARRARAAWNAGET